MFVETQPKESLKTCPDDVLVERARARDPSAFRELARRHDQTLRCLVGKLVARPSDQEDVLQNALLCAWRHLPAFEGRAKFSSWMYRVTANSALMFLRGGERRRREDSVADVDQCAQTLHGGQSSPCGAISCWIEQPEEALQCAELRAVLERLITNLSPALREVFVRRYIDGLSVKETGDLLGLSESATKTRLHRACQALRIAIHQNASDLVVCRNRGRRS